MGVSRCKCLLIGLVLLGGCGGGGAQEPVAPSARLVVWQYASPESKPPILPFKTPPQPAKGAAVTDPVYGTKIVRVTDRSVDGYRSPGIVNEYARSDPENADGTLAVLRGTEGDWHLYEVATNRHIRALSFRDNPDPEPRWHPTDPNVVTFVEGASLWDCDVTTGAVKLVRDFASEAPDCTFVRHRYEGEPSRDGRYFCLRLEDEDYSLLGVVCYDRQEDRILGRLMPAEGDWDWVGMDLSGSHCILGPGDTTDGFSYHRDFTHPIRLPHGLGHADVALDASGRDVLVYQNAATDWIAMVDLETGAETNLIPIPFSDNTDIGLHISGNCHDRPGWVLVSTYGGQLQARSWMDQCLFMLQLREHPLVWRLAQTFCLQDPAREADYFGEAFAAINHQGTRVWWGANWNARGAANVAYETYRADLPAAWEERAVTGAGVYPPQE